MRRTSDNIVVDFPPSVASYPLPCGCVLATAGSSRSQSFLRKPLVAVAFAEAKPGTWPETDCRGQRRHQSCPNPMNIGIVYLGGCLCLRFEKYQR